MNKGMRTRLKNGTSLVELLVVIVVFLIGILAVAQIFPGGFRILTTTRAESMATAIAKSEMYRIRGFASSLPEQVVPVVYTNSGGFLIGQIDGNQNEDNLGPQGTQIVQNNNPPSPWNAQGTTWDVVDSANNDLGPWQYVSGGNNIRRILGEGKDVPAPRTVGAQYGALMTLQFAPIVAPASGTAPQTLFVYGNDMDRIEGNPGNATVGQPVATYQYYVDDSAQSDPVLYIPSDPTGQREYKITLSAYINNAGAVVQRSFVVLPPIVVNSGALGTYAPIHITTLLGLPLFESLQSVEFDTIRVARMFDQVPIANSFDTALLADGSPENPYQYKLLDPALGLVLINPTAFQYVERNVGGVRTLLQARADYDVFDWRVLREDIRVPESAPYEYQLRIGNLKHHNGYEPDNTLFQGINVLVPDEQGGTERRDVVIMDMVTGGIVSKTSFTVNYNIGLITFVPKVVNNVASIGIIYPGDTSPTFVPYVNRNLRIFYMGVGEWSVQLLKAASSYVQTTSPNPLPGQFYIAPALTNIIGSPPNNGDDKIRFPNVDVGETVTLDEVWYVGGDNLSHVARGHSFVVQADKSALGGNPFISLTDLDPAAKGADYSNGYAIKGVKGASVSVRVLFNPGYMTFSNAAGANNIGIFEQWGRGWRRTSTESVIQKGEMQ